MKDWSIETSAVQAGYQAKSTEPRVLPLYQSTTFKYESSDDMAARFNLEAAGHLYSRISNPTVAALEEKIACLEGGVKAVAASSGMAAIFMSILNICKTGDNFLASASLYGGTVTLFGHTLKDLGIEVRYFENNASKEDILKLADDRTRLIFSETITNPTMEVCDLDKLVTVAKELEIPTIIDNTFATPYLCKPFDFGVDIVVYSSTKYLEGHAQTVGGIVVDSGNFKWDAKKYPELNEPDVTYHGIIYTEAFKEAAYATKLNVQLVRNIGATMAPFTAYLTNLGLETLHVRLDRHCENSLKIANYLEKNDKVSWVNYPFLESNPKYDLAKKYLKGASGVISFGVKADLETTKKFIDSLELISIVTHVCDVRSSILHPASSTHSQLSEDELKLAGIGHDLVRLSVGIENVDDIINDIENALEKAFK